MKTIIYEEDDRIARITLNRPESLNAINGEMPFELEKAIQMANDSESVHVIVLSGAGRAFCAGYDLTAYAQSEDGSGVTQDMPWDPIKDFKMMSANTEAFMSIWRSLKPVICKVRGVAVAGGSDIALCSDIIIMSKTAQIGYMPSRVWGCPTTAMWVYRVGAEKAKSLLLTGDKINGEEAERIGLVHKAVDEDMLDGEVEKLAHRIATVPINQLVMQKMVINQAVEAMGLGQSQRLATLLDGITRHSPEGLNFRKRSMDVGWKQAVNERDSGTFDWTSYKPINPQG